ncbi:hypothetical protein DPEC_G00361190 [Dallia pectoralis]|uniref:Uncharacterized protein n=1 Tax=Dallia pectoralis TaxID=75939 RepID=A0ACC2F125_DALPE|nr:hypothetical protein DPEC_G00361190 [Dallia pectoralis]
MEDEKEIGKEIEDEIAKENEVVGSREVADRAAPTTSQEECVGLTPTHPLVTLINQTEKPVSLRNTTPHPSSEHWEWAPSTTLCPIAGIPQKSTKPSENLPSGLSAAGLASWKYKDIMGHIRSKDTVAPLRVSSTVAPQQVWLNVNHHCLPNRQKDISWMVVHGCLPTREFMYRRHIALTENCPHGCNTVENTYHVLAECSVARRVWALFVLSGRGVEEGPTSDLHPERRFTGEYHNDHKVGTRPVDCSAPQVVLPPLCRSSSSGGPRNPAQNGGWSGLLTGEFHQ